MYIYKILKEDELAIIQFEDIKEDSYKSPGVHQYMIINI